MEILTLRNEIEINIGFTCGEIHILCANNHKPNEVHRITMPIFPESSYEEIIKSCGRSMSEYIINQIKTNPHLTDRMGTWRFNERLLRDDEINQKKDQAKKY